MRANTAEQLDWPVVPATTRPAPDPEPPDLAACLAGSDGLALLVELAHDLRSPLTSILCLAESLQHGQGGSVTPEQSRQLGLIYNAAFGLCTTASDVLELARGGKRLVDRAPAAFSLAETFASVRSMVLPMAEEKGIAVRLVHPVPERRVGHERAVSRVLLNLTTNAVKFTERGFVEMSARPLSQRRLEFSVRDTGAGIDAGVLATIYQPVRRNVKREHFSSSGLGLAICRKLIRAMGAELQVESRPNWGTRFFFELDCPPA
jgi:signal transduction histidine kinase